MSVIAIPAGKLWLPPGAGRLDGPRLRHLNALALLLAGCCLMAAPSQAQVFAGESASGSVVLSYMQSADTPTLVVSAPELAVSDAAADPNLPVPGRLAAAGTSWKIPALPPHYRSIILKEAREQQVPAELIAAVAAAESGFDARARSPKGAMGLMQLMPDTARRFQVTDRLSAVQSVHGGAAYLRWLSIRFRNDLSRVIAAYNAGENAVELAGGMPPFPETKAYLPRVLAYMRHFAKEFASLPG